eukprot:GAHX01009214.1.p2 GENE.GAHX01009214.1~~GAHX01009214.1.p2  ORF type:complete len:69 (-),score=2.29 GAHX01009214.1:24-230(-)
MWTQAGLRKYNAIDHVTKTRYIYGKKQSDISFMKTGIFCYQNKSFVCIYMFSRAGCPFRISDKNLTRL